MECHRAHVSLDAQANKIANERTQVNGIFSNLRRNSVFGGRVRALAARAAARPSAAQLFAAALRRLAPPRIPCASCPRRPAGGVPSASRASSRPSPRPSCHLAPPEGAGTWKSLHFRRGLLLSSWALWVCSRAAVLRRAVGIEYLRTHRSCSPARPREHRFRKTKTGP